MAVQEKVKPPRYAGAEFIRKAKGCEKDIMTVVLCGDKFYTEGEAESLIANFKKKEVNH